MSRQHKGATKRNKRRQKQPRTRELVYADDGQFYAVVTKMLGNGRCNVKCSNGLEAIGVIRGKMKFRAWVHVDDLVLVSGRDFQDTKVDIIHVYPSEHVRTIVEHENITLFEAGADNTEEDVFEFDDI